MADLSNLDSSNSKEHSKKKTHMNYAVSNIPWITEAQTQAVPNFHSFLSRPQFYKALV